MKITSKIAKVATTIGFVMAMSAMSNVAHADTIKAVNQMPLSIASSDMQTAKTSFATLTTSQIKDNLGVISGAVQEVLYY